MNLPGRLRLTTLGDVLGAVYRDGATGTLELTCDAGPVHRVHFSGGLVNRVDSLLPEGRLGEVLRRRGFIDDRTLRRLAMRLSCEPGRRAGELLIDMGALGPEEVAWALGAQRLARLERLFELRDARLAFRVAGRRETEASRPLEPKEFLAGRPRTRDKSAASEAAPARRRDPVRARALATLGLTDAADRSSVRHAFRALAVRLHPDRFPSAEPAARADLLRRFAEISAAYHALIA